VSVCLSDCLFNCLHVYLSVYLSICLSVYLSICLSIYLSLCLSVFVSAYLFLCPADSSRGSRVVVGRVGRARAVLVVALLVVAVLVIMRDAKGDKPLHAGISICNREQQGAVVIRITHWQFLLADLAEINSIKQRESILQMLNRLYNCAIANQSSSHSGALLPKAKLGGCELAQSTYSITLSVLLEYVLKYSTHSSYNVFPRYATQVLPYRQDRYSAHLAYHKSYYALRLDRRWMPYAPLPV
jgi:hypothetical protein